MIPSSSLNSPQIFEWLESINHEAPHKYAQYFENLQRNTNLIWRRRSSSQATEVNSRIIRTDDLMDSHKGDIMKALPRFVHLQLSAYRHWIIYYEVGHWRGKKRWRYMRFAFLSVNERMPLSCADSKRRIGSIVCRYRKRLEMPRLINKGQPRRKFLMPSMPLRVFHFLKISRNIWKENGQRGTA